MAQILISGLSDDEVTQLQVAAGTLGAKEARRMSKTRLAREIIQQWLAENTGQQYPTPDDKPEPIRIPPEYLNPQTP